MLDWQQWIPAYEDLINIGTSIGILLIFLLFRKLFAKYIFRVILAFSRKTPTDFFSKICLAFEFPVRWIFLIIGIYVAVGYFPYLEQTNHLFQNIIRSSIIVVISWGFYNLSSGSSILFTKLNHRSSTQFDPILIPFFSKALRFVIIAISFSIVAQEFGYNVSGFVAGLGLGGLAFALAAKDAIGNLFGGIIIITEKPFTIGDWIMTPSVEGIVEDINFRSTKIRTFEQGLVTVPNATLSNENITNWSKMGKRRISFQLGVTYDTPKMKLETTIEKIRDLLNNHQGVHPDTIFVTFDHYNDSSLDIFLYFFTNTTAWAEYLQIKEEINFSILEILEEEDVSIAFPSRTLYFNSDAEARSQVASSLEND
ncbi:mechanosensitive ion channel [Aquibacillus halophilus]|uniref:Mechanosensitive ion channel n=1 Tax=Aquibacillus halophilus TaxID=930132 RepID=A0A6A8DEK9_9BACI|nr:mechanosensitive ion channel family protein [Aquibacillus halophilus]MRH41347.1 mechanosensitive ion channel [Aquibacillus halophilus]